MRIKKINGENIRRTSRKMKATRADDTRAKQTIFERGRRHTRTVEAVSYFRRSMRKFQGMKKEINSNAAHTRDMYYHRPSNHVSRFISEKPTNTLRHGYVPTQNDAKELPRCSHLSKHLSHFKDKPIRVQVQSLVISFSSLGMLLSWAG